MSAAILTLDSAHLCHALPVQIEHLPGEVRTLNQIVGETVFEQVRKAEEVEAKSEG